MVNGDRNSNQSLRASESLLAAQTSSTPPSPSHQTAPEPEFAAADLNLDDFSESDSSFSCRLDFEQFGQCSRRCLLKGCKSVPRNHAVGKKGIEKGGVGSFGTK